MTHSFDVDIARDYGIQAAILLNSFGFWIKKNETNGKNFFDGNYWTFNSAKAFAEIFPYLSEKQIRTTIQLLVNEGLIEKGNYNKLPFDRTTWYALTDKGREVISYGKPDVTKREALNFPTGNMEVTCVGDDNLPVGETNTSYLPVNTTVNNTVNNPPIVPQSGTGFEEFWKAYPKKVGKGAALSAWKKLKPSKELLQQMLTAIATQSTTDQWTKSNGQYIPNPATWLNQSRWEDEMPKVSKGMDYSYDPGESL